MTCTEAVPFCPEQSVAPDAPQLVFPVTVMEVGKSNCGRTVSEALADWPVASRTLRVTAVSAPTLAGTTTSTLPFSVPTTGRTVWSLESIVNGCEPPLMRKVNGFPEYAMPDAGVTVSGVAIGPWGLFGAPLPPPHAASESTPARAARVRSGRSHADRRYPGMMGVLMMMS
jgi:hypothetical protein